MKRTPTILALLLLTCMVFATACAQPATTSSAAPAATSAAAPAATSAAAPASGAPEEPTESLYPITKPDGSQLTLDYWRRFNSTLIQSWDENRMYQEMEKATGVDIVWFSPPEATYRENYQLVVASDDLPDVFYNPHGYTGGAEKAVEDGIYLDLTPYMDEYAPNYMRWLEFDPQINKEARLDDGRIVSMQQVQLTAEAPWSGPWIRTDLLEKINKPMPETIDEWTEVLRLFRDELGIGTPFGAWKDYNLVKSGANDSAFASAFNAYSNFFNHNGTVKYGYVEPEYKDFIIFLRDWYAEGLFEKDFDTMEGAAKNAKFASGDMGAKVDAYGDAAIWLASGQTENPDFMISAAPYPVMNKGDDPSKVLHYRQENYMVRDNPSYVTTDCEFPELAIRFIDFSYTIEGFLLNNYGVEGESWEWAPGNPADDEILFFPPEMRDTNQHPAFTDLMLNNPDGFEFWTMVQKYKTHNGTHLRSPMSYLIGDIARESMIIWAPPGTDYYMPKIVYSTDEAKRQGELQADIEAYRDSTLFSMVKGTESVDNWDTYVQTMNNMGLQEWIGIRQAAFDRYQKR